MPSGGNQTLSRLLRGVSHVTNPFFKHIGIHPGGLWPTSERQNANVFRYAPGWYVFGAHPQIRILAPGPPASANPFVSDGPFDASGVQLDVWGPSTAGFEPNTTPGGLVQRIRGGKALLGKKVRISGAYRVDNDDALVDQGMSVWLKGRIRQDTPSTTVTQGINGTIDATGIRLTQAGAFGGVNAGDTLILESQGVFQSSSWQIASVDVLGDFIDIEAGGSTMIPALETNMAWAIARTSSQSEVVGQRGISLTTNVHTPGHIISWANLGSSYGSPTEEYLNRWSDELLAPIGYTSGNPQSHVLLAFRSYWNAPERAGLHLAGSPYGYPMSDYYHQGTIPPGTIFYLDADEWTDNPVDGNVNLHDDLISGTGDVQYFEEIVEIPDTLTLDEDDLFLILLPVKPSDQASLANSTVIFYAFNMELVTEPGATVDEGISNRMLESFHKSEPPPGAGYSLVDLVQYPIYVPTLYPLNTSWQMDAIPRVKGSPLDPGVAVDGGANFEIERYYSSVGAWTRIEGEWGRNVWSPNVALRAVQAPLPPLSIVTEFAFTIGVSQNLHLSSEGAFFLFAQHWRRPTVDSQGDTRIAQRLGPPSNVVTSTEFKSGGGAHAVDGANLSIGHTYRHRIGQFNTADAYPGQEGLARTGTAGVLLEYQHTWASGEHILMNSDGYMVVMIDPRARELYWRI